MGRLFLAWLLHLSIRESLPVMATWHTWHNDGTRQRATWCLSSENATLIPDACKGSSRWWELNQRQMSSKVWQTMGVHPWQFCPPQPQIGHPGLSLQHSAIHASIGRTGLHAQPSVCQLRTQGPPVPGIPTLSWFKAAVSYRQPMIFTMN